MRSKQYPLSFLAFFVMSAPSFAGISFNQNQAEIALAPTCSHVPISLPYIPAEASFDESLITVSSDSDWAIPSVNSALDGIEITFATEDLIASYTATISVDDGEKITELFIHANTSPLDIYRLLDDPLRSKTYGIQRDGIYNGSVIAFDPAQDSPAISCLTVGESPTDFVINDESSELLVINSVGKTIDVIDLETFSIKETINLPAYSAWGDADDTTANIALGPDDIIYYADGSWGPVLHVLKRSAGEVLQSIGFDGSSSGSYGFMDFAVTSDKTRMIAMPQYGWSAGAHTSKIGQYTINENGTVNFVKETTLSSFDRAPFEAPVLMRDDDQIAVMKTIATDPANTDNLDRVFPSAIWSMNPNGSVVATGDKLYDYDTGIELYSIPGGSISGSGYTYTKAQAFTSDFTRFVYFNSSDRTLNVVNLIDEIGLEFLGRSLNPEDGAVIHSPDTLTWAPLSGVDQYDLYLGTDYGSIAAADDTSPFYLGRVTGTNFALSQTLINGTDYFWRIDPVTVLGPETGAVYTFTISDIGLDVAEINAQTVAGHSDYQVDIQLVSSEAGVSWTASAADSWVTFTESAGSTPSTLSVHLDATMLSTGFHNSSITLTSDAGQLQIPVKFEVDPLHVIHIRSDRNSAKSYAISDHSGGIASRAYLLEIDTAAEEILRVIRVGAHVTDFTIHYDDNLIYVTNWKSGNLLAIDKSTFEHVKSIAFQPAGATGYSSGDVYRVAAGVSGRVVVEEEDQWVDLSLFNTYTETTLNQAFVREGGGAFGPTGRYYYHGENNSSGASIIKYDTSGDTFTQLADVRPPEISSYYGSRTVVISEDGSRIFWAGVALDQNLNTEWGIGDIIYSTTDDGRYAFGSTAIYDVNLRRQVFTMPISTSSSTSISGFNSTSEKLIVQVGGTLGFYPISTPISIPSPVISASNPTYNSIDLSWTDKSLEMGFVIQQRLLGSNAWSDIKNTTANVISWTAINLQEGSTYEFRIRASSPDFSSPWSNIASATVFQSIKPVVENASFSSHFTDRLQGVLTATDPLGGSLSFGIYQQPQYGSVIVNATTGGFTYVPTEAYAGSIDFQFYASNSSGDSSPATVTIELTNTAPAGEASAESMHWNSIFIGNLAGSDADEDTIHFEIVTQPSVGVLTLIGSTSGEYSYYNTSPDIDSVSFQYQISDGASSSSIYTVVINLTNSGPVAPAINLETFYTVDISTFIEGQDSDSDMLSYEMISAPALGSASLTSSGLFTYGPEGDQGYQAVIPYRVHDGKEWSEPGEIIIRVLSVDDVLNDLVTSSVYITEFSANHYAGMVPFAVDFSLAAVGGSSSYLYEWSFGDGESSIEQSPSHVFNGAGEYSVTVTITDLNDAENVATGNLTILVLSPPDEIEVDIDAGNITVDNSQFHVDFVATITGGTAPYTVSIDFGDGNSTELVSSDSTIELTYIYDSLGTYNVSAVVKSSNGVGANILGLGAQQVVVAVEQASGNADSSEGGGAIGWFLWMALFGFLWVRKASKHH